MLELKSITKIYETKDLRVEALKNVNLKFRKNEFVSILGPSGCGKTTFLNIVGGLDKYTSGDLIINDKSTKDFNDREWDSYRNHTIGFVFQTYNLIPHQTVLQNVEIALTLSGVSKEERKRRAIEALNKVGLGDKIKSKPNQLSGGQMQRVAIARALVNDPDVVLADEPTGALDSKTSVQVMELLKEVAKDRLVIMVTHNPELATKYSTRIIKFLDGELIDDSDPFDFEEAYTEKAEQGKESEEEISFAIAEPVAEVVSDKKAKKKKKEKAFKKTTMSFWTAFKLSLTNLFTKKGRTILTSFAGSIGIIGIALILAVSQGMTTYINNVQESTLASYPITLEKETVDMTSLLQSFMNVGTGELNHEKDAIYRDPVIGEMVDALSKVQTNKNDLTAFKTYLEGELAKDGSKLQQAVTGVQYTYDLELDIYTKNVNGEIVKSDTGELMSAMVGDYMMGLMNSQGAGGGEQSSGLSMTSFGTTMFDMDIWQEILPGLDGSYINDLVYEQYELIDGGSWPKAYNEIVLVVNNKNELDDLTLYALGLIDEAEIDAIIEAAVNGTTVEYDTNRWTYEQIKERTFKTILPSNKYVYSEESGIYVDISTYAESNPMWLETIYDNASLELKVTGIVRAKENVDATILSSGIAYTSKLTEYVITEAVNSDAVKAQKESPMIDLLTGMPFKSSTGILTDAQKETAFKAYIEKLTDAKKAETFIAIKSLLSPQQLAQMTMMDMSTRFPQTDPEAKRQAQEQFVVGIIAEQMGVDSGVIESYFKEMTDEQIMGITFGLCQEIVLEKHKETIKAGYASTPQDDLVSELTTLLSSATTADFANYYDNVTEFSKSTYEEVLVKLGCLDLDSPKTINLYVASFEDKDLIIEAINEYNAGVDEEKKISYVDYLGLMMSSITTIINAISYVLIAFVSISLIVSSIMIGVITLISVQERVKEIGILRALGASKKDVARMFNAETLIIGFTSGLFGVVITYLLCIPINIILKALTGIANLKAILPISAAVVLILISMGLTLISGIIPSRSASKKDPVVALRSE